MLSTFREFTRHTAELPGQVLHSGTTVHRIAGLKKNVSESVEPDTFVLLEIGCCSEPKNPVKQDWLLPFGNSRVKFLLLQIPCYFQVKSCCLHKSGGQLSLPWARLPSWAFPSPVRRYQAHGFCLLKAAAVVKTTSNQMGSLAHLRKAWGYKAKAKGPVWAHYLHHMSCWLTAFDSSHLSNKSMKMIMGGVGRMGEVPLKPTGIPFSSKVIWKG